MSERMIYMKLLRVTVDGFRNVDSTSLDLREIISLVSLNGYGKSNVLQAIGFGFDFIHQDASVRSKMMKWVGGIPLNKATAQKDFMMKIEISDQWEDRPFTGIYQFSFRWPKNDGSGERILSERFKIKWAGKNQRYFVILDRDRTTKYRKSEHGRCSSSLVLQNNELSLDKLELIEGFFARSIIESVRKMKIYIDRHLDASGQYISGPIIAKNADVFDFIEGEGNGLPKMIYFLKEKYPDKYDLLMNAYLQLFPQFQIIIPKKAEIDLKEKKLQISDNLPFTLDNAVYQMYVQDIHLNQPVLFQSLSDGAKRIFLLLTHVILADINQLSLIAIVEPENSIHPGLLQAYLQVLNQIRGDIDIVMTSHSPYIIRYQQPHDIYIGIPNAEGVAHFYRIRQSAEKMLCRDAEAEEISTGEYIFSLMSGSEDEMEILKGYLEDPEHE